MEMLLLVFIFILGVVAAEEKNRTEPATSVDFGWDPGNPPVWTIRPEDRKVLDTNPLQNRNAKLNPCEDNINPAVLYRQYFERDCPAPNQLFHNGTAAGGTCSGWDKIDSENHYWSCGAFCQTRKSFRTYFEWAQERPFPYSECHHPVRCALSKSDSVSSGWSINVSPKLGKMLKVGVSGSFSETWGRTTGRSWSVTLEKGECGYFTFVPVKKVVCGSISETDWYKSRTGRHACDRNRGPRTISNYCNSQLWLVKNTENTADPDDMIPDGTVLFVYTDCDTRMPLPMEFQDPVYRSPGVSIHPDEVQRMHKDWAWDTCYFWNMQVKGERAVYIRGSGLRDDKLGPNGEKLLEKIQACAEGTVKNHKFTWYDNGRPEDSAQERGAAWLFEGDVSDTTKPRCVGEAIMAVGGNTMDMCVGDKFKD